MRDEQADLNLILGSIQLFKDESMLLELFSSDFPIVIIGDIHGDINTLKRVITKYSPDKYVLVFLGDYIDRAYEPDGSSQTLLLLMDLKRDNLSNIFLLRGNHEFKVVNERNGFLAETRLSYHTDSIWNAWNALFEVLPVAVIIDRHILAVHGGFPRINSLDEIRSIRKNLQYGQSELLDQIVWNDYYPEQTLRQASKRGARYAFDCGQNEFEGFLTQLGVKILVRGHQPTMKGYLFNKKCITLQTCERYASYPKDDILELMPHKGCIVAIVDKDHPDCMIDTV